jgi:hypothetical protein
MTSVSTMSLSSACSSTGRYKLGVTRRYPNAESGAEGQASGQTIKGIAGHVSRTMLEPRRRIRMDAKRRPLDTISPPRERRILRVGVRQTASRWK